MEEILVNNGSSKITEPIIDTKISKLVPSICTICGASAIYSYVSVIVCSSCKMFFKRNAQTEQKRLKCPFDGDCEITILNRHVCSYCRLAKCFASGMQTEMLRSARSIQNKSDRKMKTVNHSTKTTTTTTNCLVKLNQTAHSQQLPTLNLLASDQSTLNIDQWNLLSNLSHCYDEHSGISLARRFLQEQNDLPPKIRFKLTPVGELIVSLLGQAQVLFEKNSNFSSLCCHDRSLLLRNTMSHVGGLASCISVRHGRLFDNTAFYKSAEVIYGPKTLTRGNHAIDQLDFDNTFVKLILALLTFSTFTYTYYTNTAAVNLLNIKAVLDIQHMYTELAWRYLIYKYGHDRAVICFSNLIRCLLSVNDSIVGVVELEQYNNMINSMVKKTEETFTLIE